VVRRANITGWDIAKIRREVKVEREISKTEISGALKKVKLNKASWVNGLCDEMLTCEKTVVKWTWKLCS